MNKYSIPIIIILLILYYIIGNKNSEKEEKISKLIVNNIEFSGIITDIKVSENHTFGIISLKIKNTNCKKFNPIIDKKHMYPYALKDSIAEIYTIVSDVLKKGDFIQVNSNSKKAVFSNAKGILYEDQIYITTVDVDIEFAKKNSTIIN